MTTLRLVSDRVKWDAWTGTCKLVHTSVDISPSDLVYHTVWMGTAGVSGLLTAGISDLKDICKDEVTFGIKQS